MKNRIFALALCVMLAYVPTGAAAQEESWDALMTRALSTVEELTAPEGVLRVKASASVNVVPDTAQVNLGISVVRSALSQAQSEANTIVNAIVDSLIALGIEKKDIVTSNYNISPQRDYATGDGTTITGYYVSNSITVHVDDFALLDTVIDTAVQCGANEVYGVGFDVKDRSVYYRQALADAVTAGREKANVLAASAGVELGALTSISEESSIGSYYGYSNASDSVTYKAAGATSIQGGEMAVTAEVELIYAYKVLNVEPIG